MAKAPNMPHNGAAAEQGPVLPVFYRRPRPLNNELDRGWLHLVYCHLMSMANWGRLVDLAGKRAQS